ncbi:hypothetical protein LPLAFNJD_LOCUS1939 [Methylorubrum aminovorans]
MDENQMDIAMAEVVVGLIQVRRALDPASFRDLLGSIMVEIDQGLEVALERAHRRRPAGNVVPFPGAAAGTSSQDRGGVDP